MAVIKNATLYYPKLVRPSSRFDAENPNWELQVRTSNKAQKAEWEALGLRMKSEVPDDGPPYFYCNLRRNAFKRAKAGETNRTPNDPVRVVDAKLREIDPSSIGNGSVGNVKVYQYESKKDGRIVSLLDSVQILKLAVYKQSPAFEEQEYETEVYDPDETE